MKMQWIYQLDIIKPIDENTWIQKELWVRESDIAVCLLDC